MRTQIPATLIATLGFLLVGAGPATAAPVFNLDLHHNETNFTRGGTLGTIVVSTDTQGSATNNEAQVITLRANTGSFILGFEGEETAPIPIDSSAATVQSALEALPGIGTGDIDVETRSLNGVVPAHTVTFTGALANTDVAELTAASDPANPLLVDSEIWVDLFNVGPDPTTGPVIFTVELPSGLSRRLVRDDSGAWSCPGSPGDDQITCTRTDPIPRHSSGSGRFLIALNVSPTASGDRLATAIVTGGGATDAPAASGCEAGEADCASELIHINPTFQPAGFGILPTSFEMDFYEFDGNTPERGAGGHPDLLTSAFDFHSVSNPNDTTPNLKRPAEPIRNIRVDLPPGFLGAPTAVGECSAAAFTIFQCPSSSQVGRLDIRVTPLASSDPATSTAILRAPVYNLVNPHGTLTDLGASFLSNPVHILASLDPANGYAITTHVPDINEFKPVFHQKLTIWGVPADPAHDSERCGGQQILDTSVECPSDGPLKPFVTMPFDCSSEGTMRVHSYDSWTDSGVFGPDLTYDVGRPTGCGDVPFDPAVSIAPTTDTADSPSGLDVTIELPQDDSCEQIEPAPPAGEPQLDCGIATSPLKDATVTLPEGLTVNPASANGLAACTEAQIGLGTDDPVSCPDGSKIASVEVETPALPDPVEGLVYLAKPFDNPFDSLLAGYIVLSEPSRGLLIKLPGRIEVDEDSGQISGSFEDNPQLPFSRFDLRFKGGAHSTLITPATCGDYTAEARFTPWSGTAAVEPTDGFEIDDAPGGDCPGSESSLPHGPGFDAGTVAPLAGHHSPFVVNLRREDGTQRFHQVRVSPPPGLTAKLAGTPYCPEAALAAAGDRDGKDEQSSPSCPAASRIGTVHAAAGAGPDPYWAPGTAYLAGPYKGAPLSLAILTPAVAGPFDLGTVVIRTALHVNSATAEITAVSDPIPEMLEGIPLDVRRVSVRLDRPQFTLNGTSCDPSAVSGALLSTLGALAPLHSRFQLAECGRLGFKPRIALRLSGGVKRGSYQGLRAVVRPRPGDANIGRTVVRMPRSAFVAQEHIRTVCTRVQFAADACPKGAVYGSAIAYSPLLDHPLKGDVYLRSSDNPLPDLVADLRGPAHQPIRVELAGRTDSVKGALRNTFDVVPDAPVSYFRLQLFGGKKGLIVNSRNICRGTNRAVAQLRAQNGRGALLRPVLFNRKCKQLRRKAKRRAAKRQGKRRASLSGARLSG